MKKLFNVGKESAGRAYRGYTFGYLIFALILLTVTVILFVAFNLIDEHLYSDDGWKTVFSDGYRYSVILDAGHGGQDGGANVTDDDGNILLEKDLNLVYTEQLGEFLSDLGVNVIYTRKTDVMLDYDGDGGRKMRDLKARVDIAEENPDAVFVSIHMNKFPESYVHGLGVYYSPNSEDSKILADGIKANVKRLIAPDNERENKKAGSDIYILDRIGSPCVLVECGFISNPEEARLLQSEDHRKKVVLAVGSAIIDFLYGNDRTDR